MRPARNRQHRNPRSFPFGLARKASFETTPLKRPDWPFLISTQRQRMAGESGGEDRRVLPYARDQAREDETRAARRIVKPELAMSQAIG
jgi:hypothetical protein